MQTVVLSIAVVVVALAALFAWGYTRLRQKTEQIQRAFAAIDPAEIPALAGTCSQVFASKLKNALDPSDPIICARTLDDAIRSVAVIAAFSRPGLEWAYALHTGAYLGELIRMHAGGEWRRSEDGGAPELILQRGEAKITLWPFDKVIKHRMQGESGDLVAYVDLASRGPERIAEQFTGTEG